MSMCPGSLDWKAIRFYHLTTSTVPDQFHLEQHGPPSFIEGNGQPKAPAQRQLFPYQEELRATNHLLYLHSPLPPHAQGPTARVSGPLPVAAAAAVA